MKDEPFAVAAASDFDLDEVPIVYFFVVLTKKILNFFSRQIAEPFV